MSVNFFVGIPEYVRKTVLSQVRRLLCYSCFDKANDADDIIQELLIEYLTIMKNIPDPDEPYIVMSIRHRASKILRAKAKRCFGLFSSLEEIEQEPIDEYAVQSFKASDYKLILDIITAGLSEKDNKIVYLLLSGLTIDEIVQFHHMSKTTIYKVIKKMQKKYKKVSTIF